MRTSMLRAVLAVGLIGIACSGPDDITPPVSQWESSLSGADEVPATTSAAKGNATFTLNSREDSVTYTINVTTATATAVTQAHIHNAAAGVAGNISVWLCDTPGNPKPASFAYTVPTCGTGAVGVLATGKVPVTAAQVTTMRGFGSYVNVHSTGFTGGDMRGQLRNVVQ